MLSWSLDNQKEAAMTVEYKGNISPCYSNTLRQNPPGNWVSLILRGQKPCTRII